MMFKDPVSIYGFINAKLRARIGVMREQRLADSLLRSSSLVDAVSALRSNRYREVAQVFDRTGDIQQMELALLSMEMQMYKDVEKCLSGKSADFVRTLLGKIEMDNLKNSIRLWYSSIIRERPIRFRSEYLYKDVILHPVDWTALVNATNWKTVVKAVSDTPYEAILNRFEEPKLAKDGLFELESELDRLWYTQIMHSSKSLPKHDREIAQQMFLVEVDLRNLVMLVRHGWYHLMKAEELKKLLLPWGRVYASAETQRYLATNEKDRNPIEIINKYFPGLDQERIVQTIQEKAGVTESLKIESYLAGRRQSIYRSMLSSDPFSIGVSLAYFFLCKEEMAMIKAVLNGKYYGFDETYIRGVLG